MNSASNKELNDAAELTQIGTGEMSREFIREGNRRGKILLGPYLQKTTARSLTIPRFSWTHPTSLSDFLQETDDNLSSFLSFIWNNNE